MHLVLERMGFGPFLLKWMDILFMVSAPFYVQQGTHQGCPLLPTIFALIMEPIAVAFCTKSLIYGPKHHKLEEKVALYVEDMVLFIQHPNGSLQSALQTRILNFLYVTDKALDPSQLHQLVKLTPHSH